MARVVMKEEAGIGGGVVAVAIERSNLKSCDTAMKWAAEHLVVEHGRTLLLIHVQLNPMLLQLDESSSLVCETPDSGAKGLLLPFIDFCKHKKIQYQDIVLEHSDVAQALIMYAKQMGIEYLVMGGRDTLSAVGNHRNMRIRTPDRDVLSGAPDFCTVYVISKGKIARVKCASSLSPFSPLRNANNTSAQAKAPLPEEDKCIVEPETCGATSIDTFLKQQKEDVEAEMRKLRQEVKGKMDLYRESCKETFVAQLKDDVEAEMRRLKLELRQAMECYPRPRQSLFGSFVSLIFFSFVLLFFMLSFSV